jgi:hypothetical protein
MVNFPSLTPSDFRWEAPTYEQVSHTAEDGAVVRQILMDTPGQGRVEVEFQNCRDTDFEAVLAAHDATYGQWDALILPDAFWGGRGAALRAVIEDYHSSLEWAFAEVPAADWAKKGRCTIRVILKHRVRPLALVLDPGGTATPLVPMTDPGTPAVVDALPVLNCNIPVPPTPDVTGCQTFWTSRLNALVFSGLDTDGSTVIDSAGNVYSIMFYAPFGAAVVTDSQLLLTKRDKDGVVLWQRITPPLGPGYNQQVFMHLDADNGVVIRLRGNNAATGGRIWRISASGAQTFHTVYGELAASYQGGLPLWNIRQTLSKGAFILTERGAGSQASPNRFMRISAATGAVESLVTVDNSGNVVGPPLLLPSGNMVVYGVRASAGWVAEIDPALGPSFMAESYVYPATSTNGFVGMVAYAAGYFAVGGDGNYYVLDAAYSVVQAFQHTSMPATEIRGMSEGPNGLIYIAYRGNQLYVVDLINQVARVKRQEVTRNANNVTQVPLEGTYYAGSREALNVAAGMGTGWTKLGVQAYTGAGEERFVAHSIGFNIPAGTYNIETHPPYTNRDLELVVTESSVPLTTIPLPARTDAVVSGYQVQTVTAPPDDFERPFANETTLLWDLQSAPICPPAFNTTIAGPATAVQGVAQQYTAVIIPDPTLTTWPYAYFWSSPNATFSDNKIANPMVTWTATGTKTLSAQVSNAGSTKTVTLDVVVGTGPPPPTGTRYWRIAGVTLTGSYLEISELQLFNSTTQQTGTLTVSDPGNGPWTNLTDGNLSTRCYWLATVATSPAFWMQFDFGATVAIDGVKLGGFDTQDRYPTGFRLESSPDGTTWTAVGTKSGLVYPGNNTLSALIPVP